VFPQKLPRGGSGPSFNTWYLGPIRIIKPNGISIGSAVYVWSQMLCCYNALSLGKKTLKIATSSWDFVTLPKEDRATAIGNMRKNLAKIARVVPEICWRTDRHTHRRARWHQYFVMMSSTKPEVAYITYRNDDGGGPSQ